MVWDNERAIAVRIDKSLLPSSTVIDSLTVHLLNEHEPVLGELEDEYDALLFTPHLSFTGGLTYEVRYSDRQLGMFSVPIDTTLSAPELLAVYPSGDTLPENLLKMYVAFSEPMVEGSSLSHIYMIRDPGDTLEGTFLDLKPELWNNDATVLTLWLDPGRVKRDLIPNQTLGKPIERGSQYTLVIQPGWRSKQGAHTKVQFLKSFYVATRDETIPNPDRWKIAIPRSSTYDSLIVHFDEPLDFRLVTDAIHLLDIERRLVEAEVIVGDDERSLYFVVINPWSKGSYALMIEPRLEDLAGNNLIRVFDRDLLAEQSGNEEVAAREIPFNIP